MIKRLEFNRKNKTMKLIISDANGYPIYYEDTITLKELKQWIKELEDEKWKK